ncbi:MAG TPA: SPFH domain-containing protein [Phycisphaerae bacterium]|nr:SPFH domain-containing protein [Phycisphaerae bacterium]
MSDSSPDQHPHRTLHVTDAPFDAANQSLADALRASFGVLKAIMIILVVWFLLNGLTCVQENEQAVVFRLGKLLPTAHGSGLSWAFPYPFDETLCIGVTAETLTFDSHWFGLMPDEVGVSLGRLSRGGQGLNPAHDGALLTADKGLAHVKWSLVYRITDLSRFVRNVSHTTDEKARKEMTRTLIQTLLENAAVRAASMFTAAEITQTRTDAFAREVRTILAAEFDLLQTGIELTAVEIPEATVPLQTRKAFLAVIEAESEKTIEVQKADQKRNELLNKAAGPAYRKLIGEPDAAIDRLLPRLEAARAGGEDARAEELEQAIGKLNLLEIARSQGDQAQVLRLEEEVDRILEEEASGTVGAWIRRGESEYQRVIQGLRGDVEQYQTLVAEYEQTPRLLIERKWQETMRKVLAYPGVNKWWLPGGRQEVRIKIGPDPLARREAEITEYQKSRESEFEEPEAQRRIIIPEDVTAGPGSR